MKAMTQSALAVVSALAVATSLAACNQSTPGRDTTSSRATPGTSSTADSSSYTPSPASTAANSSSMTPAPSSAATSPDKMAAADTSKDTTKAAPGNDDAALIAQVKTALQSDPALRAQAIQVDIKDATVTLTGAVDSAASKAKANEVAAGVSGVAAVVDHLTIKAS